MSEAKRQAALKAIEYVEHDSIIGVGTGSTVAYFIEALGEMRDHIRGAVSSSEQSTARLRAVGIEVLDLNNTGTLSLYVDGADECDPHKRLIKGGGAALTREKIIAEASSRFVCIVDPSKQVDVLGRFPLPVEVIPMARSLVAREILAMTRAQPVWRQNEDGSGVVTDNGNVILDIHGLAITDPLALEQAINQIPGVVSVGLFARRPADVVIVGGVCCRVGFRVAQKDKAGPFREPALGVNAQR